MYLQVCHLASKEGGTKLAFIGVVLSSIPQTIKTEWEMHGLGVKLVASCQLSCS